MFIRKLDHIKFPINFMVIIFTLLINIVLNTFCEGSIYFSAWYDLPVCSTKSHWPWSFNHMTNRWYKAITSLMNRDMYFKVQAWNKYTSLIWSWQKSTSRTLFQNELMLYIFVWKYILMICALLSPCRGRYHHCMIQRSIPRLQSVDFNTNVMFTLGVKWSHLFPFMILPS